VGKRPGTERPQQPSSGDPTVPEPAAPERADTLSGPNAQTTNFPFLRPAETPDELGRLGSYRVLRLLGEGGMGMVFLAQDCVLERAVALKVMKPDRAATPDARRRFLQEARAAASLAHDHIVTIFQVGEDNGVLFLAMPHLQGESLESRLRRERRLPPAEVVRIGREVAEGLAAAHQRGLIHRDVKPGNIWLEAVPGEQGKRAHYYRVKLLDFGLAREVSAPVQPLTQPGAVLGTPGYIAPEQASGGRGVNHRADLFSLGCVLYHACTGELPFQGENMIATLVMLATDDPPPIRPRNPSVPAELEAVIIRLLAKQPCMRPQSAQEVASALAKIERGLGASIPKAGATVAIERGGEAGPGSGNVAEGQSSWSDMLAGVMAKLEKKAAEAGPERPPPASPSDARPAGRTSGSAASVRVEPGRTQTSGSAGGVRAEPGPAHQQEPPSGQTHPEVAWRPRPSAPAESEVRAPATYLDAPESESSPACPHCGSMRWSTSQADVCLNCGRPRQAPPPPEPPPPAPSVMVPIWCAVLFFGVVAIATGSVVADLTLSRSGLARACCGTALLMAGVVAFLGAELWAYILVLPRDTEISFYGVFVPTKLWMSALRHLPATRNPVCLAGWSVAAILCAAIVIGGQLYWLKKPKPETGPVAAASNADETLEDPAEDPDDYDGRNLVPDADDDLRAGDLDPDLDSDDPEMAGPRFTRQYVIIGYRPEGDRTVAALVVAESTEGGYRLAGSIPLDRERPVKKDAYEQVSRLKVRSAPVVESKDADVIWVEPTATCQVSYGSIDEKGHLQRALVTGFAPEGGRATPQR
jgi:serine/threonine protein kinase